MCSLITFKTNNPIHRTDMHTQYALVLSNDSVYQPGSVDQLSPADVKRNLEAHAKYNAKISTAGTKEDLEERLKELLDRRQKDFAVRSFLVQSLA